MKIVEMQRWGRAGWSWGEFDGEKTSYYRTNGSGEGLWTVNPKKGDHKQVLGTCQHFLPEDRQAARRKIRRSIAKGEAESLGF